MTGRHAAGRAQRPAQRRERETSEYVAFLQRAINGLYWRAVDDPAALVHFRDLITRLQEAENLAVYRANTHPDARRRFSQRELARIYGISQPAIRKRVGLGAEIGAAIEAMLGAVRLADIRRQRGELLAAAEVADRAGSAREVEQWQAARDRLRAAGE